MKRKIVIAAIVGFLAGSALAVDEPLFRAWLPYLLKARQWTEAYSNAVARIVYRVEHRRTWIDYEPGHINATLWSEAESTGGCPTVWSELE